MNTTPIPLLFVSGAGLPDWIWDPIRGILEGPYESTIAARPSQVRNARLDDYVDAAAASSPSGRFAVVAHSSGGVVASELVRRSPDRILAFLAVAAVVPQPGDSFLSAMPWPNRWILGSVIRVMGTRPPTSAIQRSLCAGLDPTTAQRVSSDFRPESPYLFRDRTQNSPVGGPRGYLTATQDRELPRSLQASFATNLDPGWLGEVATGHLPMLEDPSGLADAVRRFLAVACSAH